MKTEKERREGERERGREQVPWLYREATSSRPRDRQTDRDMGKRQTDRRTGHDTVSQTDTEDKTQGRQESDRQTRQTGRLCMDRRGLGVHTISVSWIMSS
jgi:hypothetical protein